MASSSGSPPLTTTSTSSSSSSVSPKTVQQSTPQSERTPLLRDGDRNRDRPRPTRNVTFNANPVSKTIFPDPVSLSSSPASISNFNTFAATAPPRSKTIALGSATSSTRALASTVSPGTLLGTTQGQNQGKSLSLLNNRTRRRNSHGGFPALSTGSLSGGTGASTGTSGPHPFSKIGPQRSSKNAQKLKLLPNPSRDSDGTEGGAVFDQDSDLHNNTEDDDGRDVYSQYARIKDPTARRDAARLGKADRERLPRVTAYCTANKYQMDGLMRFLKGRGRTKGANPKRIDECIYTPYNYGNGKGVEREGGDRGRREDRRGREGDKEKEKERERDNSGGEQGIQQRRHSTGVLVEESPDGPNGQRGEGGNGHESRDTDTNTPSSSTTVTTTGRDIDNNLTYPPRPSSLPSPSNPHQHSYDDHNNPQAPPSPTLNTTPPNPELFLFDYGVVVIWGMSLVHEQRFLRELAKFEFEKLAPDDVETECFNYYYTREYQARIYNDFITLRENTNGKTDYMTKLAISHALAQSVKTSLFEELIADTVEKCKDIPAQIALTGTIKLSRREINMQIGELFILRINIHLNGSVLDTPELFWVEPALEPVYRAVRTYLEMDPRVGLLSDRLDVLGDLLAVLKGELSHGHGEMLEWIVIVLIAAEILVAAVNILVDLWAGVD